MNDYGLSVLAQYGLTAKTVSRGRGILVCETEAGTKAISPCRASEAKLQQQYEIQQHCREANFPYIDCLVKNQEGNMLSKDEDENVYIVRDWFVGKECDTRAPEEILTCVGVMAKLHEAMCIEQTEAIHNSDLVEECQKHNRELRKIRKYMQKKKKLNEFEEIMSRSISKFIEQGERAAEGMEREGYRELLAEHGEQICHGECTQHNFIFTRDGVAVTNFEHWNYGLQIVDLSHFMRKILEKHQWNLELGREMLARYDRKRPLSTAERRNLIFLLAYPWRYWKLANFYANSNKAWISRKNIEKLNRTIGLWEAWNHFLEHALC